MNPHLLMTLALVATSGSGCVATRPATTQNESTSTLHARYTATPVVIAGQVLVDHGAVQLAHDDEYLYVAFRFED